MGKVIALFLVVAGGSPTHVADYATIDDCKFALSQAYFMGWNSLGELKETGAGNAFKGVCIPTSSISEIQDQLLGND